jgi:large subunit ribosomal protein L6
MSRIGRQPVTVPPKVAVSVGDGQVQVSGPKGELTQSVVDHVSVAVSGGRVEVTRVGDSKSARANHGLMRSLIQNMVTGVTSGFVRELEIIGVGYRAEVRGGTLVMQLGYSHPVEYTFPSGVAVVVERNTKVTVSGADKQLVGQVAAVIRGYRPPDSYKGKGVRYKGEYIRLKQGKSA